jgi:hypothetical protein
MRQLVGHHNFPGQVGHFVKTWAQRPGCDLQRLWRQTVPRLAVRRELIEAPNARNHVQDCITA